MPAIEDKGLEAPTPKDDDPDGLKILSATDGMERATKLLQPLTNLVTKNIDVWIAAYDVAVRRSKCTLTCYYLMLTYVSLEKYLQAVKALNIVHSLDAEHPELHIRLVDLRRNCTTHLHCYMTYPKLGVLPSDFTPSATSRTDRTAG
jgi:N-alpha-acetyltransferase 15/16, NatA auxiliary subunit